MDLEQAKMRLGSLATLGGTTREAIELVLVRLAELDGATVSTEYGVRYASGRTAARIGEHAARWSADVSDEAVAVNRTVLTARTEWTPLPAREPQPARRWQDAVHPDVAAYAQQVRIERGLPVDPYADQHINVATDIAQYAAEPIDDPAALEIVQLSDQRASGGDR